ncbi:MAG: hypothetical protein Q4B42_05905 [Oscillospiraceae bacterium]|nr:hypothetical protein [Oscillospiraceae bacterium]
MPPESEHRIKRAYEDGESKRLRRKRAKAGVTRLQCALSIIIFTLLLLLKLFSPQGFLKLTELYEELWRQPELLSLESSVSEAAEGIIAAAREGFDA